MPYHRSEEHTSELQSHDNLVCRLLLEKKKTRKTERQRGPGGGCPVASARCVRGVLAYRSGMPRASTSPGDTQNCVFFFFFFNDRAPPEIYPLSLPDALPINDTATTEIYTLSLHDALPISVVAVS